MPDLHEWITEQIDNREQLALLITPGGYEPDEWRTEPSRSNRWQQVVAYSRTLGQPAEAAARESDQPVALVQTGRNEHLLIAMHDPAGVLRRCEADRKILTIHAPAGGTWNPYACNGCGIDSEYGHEVLHTNDCETLLALAEGHGLTPEILATLDRPEPEPPKRTSPSLAPDALIEAMYGDLMSKILERWTPHATPMATALRILQPELKKISSYVPTTEDDRPA